MSKFFGSSKKTTSSTTVDPRIMGQVYSNIDQANQIASKPFEAYTGDRFAGFTQDTQDAFARTRDAAGAVNPYTSEAAAMARNVGGFNPVSAGPNVRAQNIFGRAPALNANAVNAQGIAPIGSVSANSIAGLTPTLSAAEISAPTIAGAGNIGAERVGAVSARPVDSIGASMLNQSYDPRFMTAANATDVSLDPYMNPYVNDVINAGLSDLDRAADQQQTNLAAAATGARAFGGSRDAIQRGIAQGEAQRERARFLAESRMAAVNQAMQARELDVTRRQDAARANMEAGMRADELGFNAAQSNQRALLEAAQANQRTGTELSSLDARLASDAMSQNARNALDAAMSNQRSSQEVNIGNARNQLEAALSNQRTGLDAGSQNLRAYLDSLTADQRSSLEAQLSNQNVQRDVALGNARNALDADLANQRSFLDAGSQNLRATMDSLTADQRANLEARLANQRAGLDASMANQRAELDASRNQLDASRVLADLGQLDISNAYNSANALNSIGQQQQALNQQGLDFNYDEFLRRLEYDPQMLALRTSVLSGMPYNVTQTGKTTSTPSVAQMIGQAASLYAMSDKRLKKSLSPITGALPKLRKIHGSEWDWKDGSGPDAGVIAQDVEKAMPEAVSKRGDGMRMVNMPAMVGLLTESVKELDQKVSKKRRRKK
ncbi:MAG: tail fiber domain-containing protein [Candidatus Limnocylindrus sp.]